MSKPGDATDHVITCGATPILTKVIMTAASWAHIKSGHPEVPYEQVVEAITDPCHVTESRTGPGTYLLINTFATNSEGQELRVPVKPFGDGTAVVKTAYYGNASSHGTIVWSRGDE